MCPPRPVSVVGPGRVSQRFSRLVMEYISVVFNIPELSLPPQW